MHLHWGRGAIRIYALGLLAFTLVASGLWEQAMGSHVVSVEVRASAALVLGVLETRPTRWLRPFLELAARNALASVGEARPPAQPAFRLGWARRARAGARLRFVWRPRTGELPLRRFAGWLWVTDEGEHCRLTLRGVSSGSSHSAANRALYCLLRLLSDGVTAGHPRE